MTTQPKSVQDLWVEAFKKLDAEDAQVLDEHEKQLAGSNNILINKALYEKELRQWCIILAGKPLKIRELGTKIISFVSSSQQYVSQIAALEPHAAIAWTCVSLLLPLITNQNSQVEAMLSGLDRISYLIDFYTKWHDLYAVKGSDKLQETVVKLYCAILTYQARMLHYLSKRSINRKARDAVKKDTWEAWLEEVDTRDKQCVELGKLDDISQERQDRARQSSLMETQTETTELILDTVYDMNKQQLQQVSEKEREELVRCFSSNYRSQKDANPKRVPGTCEWFMKDQKYIDWRDSKESCLLHVFAGPGYGKSVLVRHLIDSGSLKSSSGVTVLYFFFKEAQEGQDRSANALAAMLHQLYSQKDSEAMIVHALPKFKSNGNNLIAMFEDLWDILKLTIEDPVANEIVCVFDALDECCEKDRARLLTKVTEYFENSVPLQKKGGKLKVLVTSRPYEDISMEYKCLEEVSTIVQLDGNDKIELIAKEINLVIDFAVPRALPAASEEVHKTVVERLKLMNNRTYLWLYLILDYVKKNSTGKNTPRKIDKLISTLPSNVNAAYTEMLRRSKDCEQARVLLHLVLAARRPLTVSELKIAAALVEEGADYRSYQEVCDETESVKQFKDSLQVICGLMLVVHDSCVYFIHQTAREYLCNVHFVIGNEQSQWLGPISTEEADTIAARSCLTLLNLEDFSYSHDLSMKFREATITSYGIDANELFTDSEISIDSSQIPIDKRNWALTYDFLEYASVYWSSHVQNASIAENSCSLDQQVYICSDDSPVFWIWYSFYCDVMAHSATASDNGLVFASSYGYETLARLLVQSGCDVNHRADHKGSALQIAAEMGHDKIVKILLDNGADINAFPQGGINPLIHASMVGNNEIVRILLNNGADVNTQDEHDNTALQLASIRGFDEIVQMLLNHSADVNIQSGYYVNALIAAAMGGFENIVRMLLDNGADINACGEPFGNARQAATTWGHYKVAELLLQNGADANARGRHG